MGTVTSVVLATDADQREDMRCAACTELIGEKIGLCSDVLAIVGCVKHPSAKPLRKTILSLK